MPFDEQKFCQSLQTHSLTFTQISKQLARVVKKESEGRHVISASTQAVIYERLPTLLPGFRRDATSESWGLAVHPQILGHWVIGLSLFEPGATREALLKNTAILLRQVPHTAKDYDSVVNNMVLTLEDMQDSAGVRAILRELALQLADYRYHLAYMTATNVLHSLKNKPDSDAVRAVLNALLGRIENPHGNWNEALLSTEAIARAIYGLQNLSTSREVNRILAWVAPKILVCKARHERMSSHLLAMAFGGMRNMQASAEAKQVVQALHAHLCERPVEVNTSCYVLYGLRNMGNCAEVRAVLATLLPHLRGYIYSRHAFSVAQLNMVLDGLKGMAAFPEAIEIYQRLWPQIIAAAVKLEAKALGGVFLLLAQSDAADTPQRISMLLTCIESRIQDIDNPLDSGTVACILSSLKKFPFSLSVNLTLAGLKKHLDKNAGQWLTSTQVLDALQGLPYMPVSKEIEEIVAALALHMHATHSVRPGLPIVKKRWLAEVIFSLRHHFSLQRDATVARHFLQAAARVQGLALDTERLRESTLMGRISQLGQYMSWTTDRHIELNTHTCSVPLMQALGEMVMREMRRAGTAALTIVFGSGERADEQYLQGKKYALLRSILANEPCDWRVTGQVTVRRESSLPAGHTAALQSLQSLFPKFAEDVVSWIVPMSPQLLNDWLARLFAPDDTLKALLEDIVFKQVPRTAQDHGERTRRPAEDMREIWRVIAQQLVNGHYEKLDFTTVGNILFRLKDEPDCDKVRAMLSALLPSLRTVGNIRYRLKDGPDGDEVRTMLSTLPPSLGFGMEDVWRAPEEIAGALYGLQNLSATPEVEGILNEIASHLLACKAQNKLMNPNALAIAFWGLRNMRPCSGVERVVQALHAHLRAQTVEMHILMSILGHILHGLRHLKDSAEARAVLATLLSYLRQERRHCFNTKEMNLLLASLPQFSILPGAIDTYQQLWSHIVLVAHGLNVAAIKNVFFLLSLLPDASDTQEWVRWFLESVEKRIQALNPDSVTIAFILNHLHKQPSSVVIRLMQAGLNRQLADNARAGQYLTSAQILYALQGLQYLPLSGEVEEAVAALALHIHPVHSVCPALPLAKKRWLAEVIFFSLRHHLSSSDKAMAARYFVQAAARVQGMTLDMERLLRDLMGSLLSLGKYITLLTEDRGIQLDICHSSIALSQALCKTALVRMERGEIRPLTILFASEAAPDSAEERDARAEKYALLRSMLTGEAWDWGTAGRVTRVVEEQAVSQPPAMTSATQPGLRRVKTEPPASPPTAQPARKRIKTELVSSPVIRTEANAGEEIDIDEETDAEEEFEEAFIKTEAAGE